jgi:phosphoserine aminotransferase
LSQVYNFSPGPAMVPREVLEQLQYALLDYEGMGLSIAEISHRSLEFKAIVEESIADLRELLNIPSNYQVLFLTGGARSQFSMIPMNFAAQQRKAAYLDFGHWGHLAIDDVRAYCDVKVVADNRENQRQCIIAEDQWSDYSDCAYLYAVDNETVDGLELSFTPDSGDVPLISDMSSNILSRPFDLSRYAMIFACAQKNLGIAGISIAIIRDDLLQRDPLDCTPIMYRYQHIQAKDSLPNTVPTVPWFTLGLVLKWIKKEGGLSVMAERNQRKADKLYRFIDNNDFYINMIALDSRSRMNVVFHLRDESKNQAFLQQAKQAGLHNLKGHKAIGGMRASIYNAMPEEGVDALLEFMRDFSASVK